MSYLVKLVILSAVVALCLFAWNYLMPVEYTNTNAYLIIPFFFAYSYFTHISLTKAMKSENKNAFTMKFMGATAIKLFFSLIFIIVYAFINKKEIIPFAVLFLFLYIVFTVFETMVLLGQLKQNKQSNN